MRRQVCRRRGRERVERLPIGRMRKEQAAWSVNTKRNDVAAANGMADQVGFDVVRWIEKQRVGPGLEAEMT
jgi:hypothetical protein